MGSCSSDGTFITGLANTTSGTNVQSKSTEGTYYYKLYVLGDNGTILEDIIAVEVIEPDNFCQITPSITLAGDPYNLQWSITDTIAWNPPTVEVRRLDSYFTGVNPFSTNLSGDVNIATDTSQQGQTHWYAVRNWISPNTWDTGFFNECIAEVRIVGPSVDVQLDKSCVNRNDNLLVSWSKNPSYAAQSAEVRLDNAVPALFSNPSTVTIDLAAGSHSVEGRLIDPDWNNPVPDSADIETFTVAEPTTNLSTTSSNVTVGQEFSVSLTGSAGCGSNWSARERSSGTEIISGDGTYSYTPTHSDVGKTICFDSRVYASDWSNDYTYGRDSACVTVTTPTATTSCSFSPTSVVGGNSSTLTWNTGNLSNGYPHSVLVRNSTNSYSSNTYTSLSGTRTVNTSSGDTGETWTYTVRASADGTWDNYYSTTNCTLAIGANPTIDVTCPSSVSAGNPINVGYTIGNANNGRPEYIDVRAGSTTIIDNATSNSGSTNYSTTASQAGTSVTFTGRALSGTNWASSYYDQDTCTTNINAPSVNVDISASSTSVCAGSNFTLNWSTSNPSSGEISMWQTSPWGGQISSSNSGSTTRSHSSAGTYVYEIIAFKTTNSDWSSQWGSDSVSITINNCWPAPTIRTSNSSPLSNQTYNITHDCKGAPNCSVKEGSSQYSTSDTGTVGFAHSSGTYTYYVTTDGGSAQVSVPITACSVPSKPTFNVSSPIYQGQSWSVSWNAATGPYPFPSKNSIWERIIGTDGF